MAEPSPVNVWQVTIMSLPGRRHLRLHLSMRLVPLKNCRAVPYKNKIDALQYIKVPSKADTIIPCQKLLMLKCVPVVLHWLCVLALIQFWQSNLFALMTERALTNSVLPAVAGYRPETHLLAFLYPPPCLVSQLWSAQ